jgi:hypothetical protein
MFTTYTLWLLFKLLILRLLFLACTIIGAIDGEGGGGSASGGGQFSGFWAEVEDSEGDLGRVEDMSSLFRSDGADEEAVGGAGDVGLNGLEGGGDGLASTRTRSALVASIIEVSPYEQCAPGGGNYLQNRERGIRGFLVRLRTGGRYD